MLVLNRKIGQNIIIGDDVYITYLGIKGDSARIGISAPTELSVHREEVFNRIKNEKSGELKSS